MLTEQICEPVQNTGNHICFLNSCHDTKVSTLLFIDTGIILIFVAKLLKNWSRNKNM